MKAIDVMVRNVVTIGINETVQDAAALLLKHRISGVPVVDPAGRVVGILTEGDLLHRIEAGTIERRPWLAAMLTPKETLAADYVKSHSRKISDVMTRDVITASPSTSLREIASLFEKHGIKRVPIIDNDALVGIVSRANLIQAVAIAPPTVPSPDDAALRNQIISRITASGWTHAHLLNVIVHHGTVELSGIVASEAERTAARVAAEITPGVQTVEDNLAVRRIETWG